MDKAFDNSRLKLAQLWHIVNGTTKELRKIHLHNRIVNEILKDNFNVNQKISVEPQQFKGLKVHLKECTALHFVSYYADDIDTFNILLQRGADFTIKNKKGQTALHLMMITSRSFAFEREMPFINSVLSAHVKLQNSQNPRNDNGLSHLHGACMANHVEAVQLFLDSGISIEEKVSLDAPQFAGYTPLHFAVEYYSLEVTRILVSRGANVNAQNLDGASPLDLLMESFDSTSEKKSAKREQMIKLLLEQNAVSAIGFSNLEIACTLKDLTMAERLLDEGADIEYAVSKKSRGCSGNTAYHFAVNNSVEAVQLLLKSGAKLEEANNGRQTAFDLCISKYSLADVCKILSCSQNWKQLCLSDGKIKLADLIPVMSNREQFKLFLQNKIADVKVVVASNSKLWPGYSLLHLAVTFSKNLGIDAEAIERKYDSAIVEECLQGGVSVNVQDVKGQTPIHLAFRLHKNIIVKILMERLNESDEIENLVDEDNLSYLHIACAVKCVSVVEKLLTSCEPNISYNGKENFGRSVAPGSTPLHVIAVNGSDIIAEMLLRRGANLHAPDRRGWTPIHWLLKYPFRNHEIANVFFSSFLMNPQDHVVDGLNLSYLHVACLMENTKAVEKLLDLGSNVNALVEPTKLSKSGNLMHFVRLHSDSTPLLLASKKYNGNKDILDLLLRHGADAFTSIGNLSPIQNKAVLRGLFQVLWEQNDSQKLAAEKLQLTRLHIACYLKNEQAIRTALNEKPDINARVSDDAVLFAGCTPLHLLVSITDSDDSSEHVFPHFIIINAVKILIDCGADVTIANVKNETAIHVFFRNQKFFHYSERCKIFLLNAQKDFSINPVNSEGLSHFHLSCLWHQVELVDKFLQKDSVDINRPIDYFAKNYAGSTPLHLSLINENGDNTDWTKLLGIIDLLLKNGADFTARDVYGDTPMHKTAVLQSPKLNILDKLISQGADVTVKNLQGQTPIEICLGRLNAISLDRLKIFQKYGYKINSWNNLTDEGYIAKIFTSNNRNLADSSEFEEFLKSSEVRAVDDMGRNAMHNSVAVVTAVSESLFTLAGIENYTYAIESFIKIGIDLEAQDKSGQTALHYAARMENAAAVKALLTCGADVNIVDFHGKTAFSYAVENSETKNNLRYSMGNNPTKILRLHLKKLQHLKIEVSQLDENLLNKIEHFFNQNLYSMHFSFFKDAKNLSEEFFSQVELTKNLDVGTNALTLFNFLSHETGVVNLYPFFLESERELINGFFDTIDYKQLHKLTGIIKLQCKKMITRLSLIDAALRSLRTLMGFSVPGLCEQISRFLLNSDLKNLIASTVKNARKRKISEI